MRFFRDLTPRFRRFRQDEEGNATVEFVLLFPLYMWVFISSIESGLLMTRNAMLERGVDLVVREMRLNATWEPGETELKRAICSVGGMFDNCEQNLRVETTRLDPRNPNFPPAQAPCVDRQNAGNSGSILGVTGQNDIVLMRVCALVDPIIPNYQITRAFSTVSGDINLSGLGSIVPLQSGGGIALVVSTLYVVEPQ